MGTKRIEYVTRNMLWGIPLNLLSTILPFISRTLMIRYLGSEYLGLNGLCTYILYALNAVDLGMSDAFIFHLYKPVAEKNIKKVNELLHYYRHIYCYIGGIIFTLGIILLPFLECFISGEIPKDVNIYWVFFIYLINTVCTYIFFGYKELIINAEQRRDYSSMVTCISCIFLYLFQIIFILKRNYYDYLLVLPLSTLLCNFLKALLVKKKFPEYTCSGKISCSMQQMIKKDISSVAVYRLRDASRTTLDSVFVSAFCGLTSLSCYQNYNMVMSIPILLKNMVYNALISSIGNYIATETKEKVYKIYSRIMFIYLFLSSWFSICYYFLVQDFMVIWVGKKYLLGNKEVVLFSLYFFLLGVIDLSKMLMSSACLWKYGRKQAVMEIVTNLTLNYIFIGKYGISGIIMATIFSVLIFTIFNENRIIYQVYFKRKPYELFKFLFFYLIWTVITWFIIWICCNSFLQSSIIVLLIKIIICIVVPMLTFTLFFFHTEDFKFFLGLMVGLCKKMLFSTRKRGQE